MGLAILLGVLAVSVVAGIPVAFAMGLSALSAFWYEGFPILITFQRTISGISVFSLLAIPFFIFAGELMLHGGIAARLVRFASALVGHIRGGLASVNIFSSMLFGGISGSAIADISALGSLLVPVMKERGYRADYAVNVTVTSSIAGIVIPPSHNMIIFAVAAGGGISISKLFLAGVLPGILMCSTLAFAAFVIARKHKYPADPFPGWGMVLRSAVCGGGGARACYSHHHRGRRAVGRVYGNRVWRVWGDLCAAADGLCLSHAELGKIRHLCHLGCQNHCDGDDPDRFCQ